MSASVSSNIKKYGIENVVRRLAVTKCTDWLHPLFHIFNALQCVDGWVGGRKLFFFAMCFFVCFFRNVWMVGGW